MLAPSPEQVVRRQASRPDSGTMGTITRTAMAMRIGVRSLSRTRKGLDEANRRRVSFHICCAGRETGTL